jgi:hypothetical protein
MHVLPGIVRRPLIHRTYGFDPAIWCNEITGSLETTAVARKEQYHRGVSVVRDVCIVQEVGFEGG